MTQPIDIFAKDTAVITQDTGRRKFIRDSLGKYKVTRKLTEDTFTDWQKARQVAADIKWETIEHLDTYLEQFADGLESHGTKVHWASNADQARKIILDIAESKGVKKIIKSKCMTTEEIHLNDALEAEGYDVIESDLGEYIVQLREEQPYHFVFPSMHLKKEEVSELFTEKLGSPPSDNAEELTMIAREALRQKYLEADMGISGANFGVAETGMISITENEGNARLTTSLPKIHVAVMGIEKMIPKLEDLAILLPMLGTAGTGQWMTGYNSMIGGPRQPDELDGPEQFHVVLLDNQRTRLLADPEQRDALRCIRCGACLNVCPIFNNIGGHAYGTTYQGPIGSVITPHLKGLKDWKHLSYSSSLCGACTETCPVKIDLHHHLLRNRRNAMTAHPNPKEKKLYRMFGFLMTHPKLYSFACRMSKIFNPIHGLVKGKALDPAKAWTATRDLPDPPKQSFKEYWKNHE